MATPHHIASTIVGAIDWQSEVYGYCRCPGESFHTHKTGKRDCRVSIDGAPTVHCFHSSCHSSIAEANLRLRRALGAITWELKLPSGQTVRNGDILQSSGQVLRREVIQASRQPEEKLVLETVRQLAERFRPDLHQKFHWPFARIIAESPIQAADRDAEDQFRTWLRLWPASCHLWIGDVFSSGKPEHRTNFRPVAEWYKIGPALGNYTCGSSFKPGSFSRSNENLNGHRFLVVESDTLTKDQVGAVFNYLHKRLRYRLHCVIDTAGKSLHGWFDAPRNKNVEQRLKVGLEVLGCDPKVFTYSQPVRVPGAFREGRLQRLVWLRDGI